MAVWLSHNPKPHDSGEELYMSFDLYAEVTNQIVAMLDAGVVPWRSPILGRCSAGHPKNLITGYKYRGINVFLLAFTAYTRGYESSYWLTFNQAAQRGGSIKKGEKSSMVVFWKQYETEDQQTGEPKTVPLLRYFNVFNICQVNGITAPDAVILKRTNFTPIESAEAIVTDYAGGPAIEHGGSQAFYRPASDVVRMPEPTRFTSGGEYYSTLFHELAHSTGHSSRLNRGLDSNPKPFGTPDYGREELVAEMASAFICGEVGIHPNVIENQAAYIGGWLRQLKMDKKIVIAAAGAAQKAVDWIFGQRG